MSDQINKELKTINDKLDNIEKANKIFVNGEVKRTLTVAELCLQLYEDTRPLRDIYNIVKIFKKYKYVFIIAAIITAVMIGYDVKLFILNLLK